MMYGKLIDGELRGAPRPLKTADGDIFTNDPVVYLGSGYKEVITTDYPQDGKYYVSSWFENDTQIAQTWAETDPPEDISAEEALSIITGGDEV